MQEIIFLARFLILVPLAVVAFYLLDKRDIKIFVRVILSIVVINLLSEVTKFIIPIQRPYVGMDYNPGIWTPISGGSFFSSHTGTLFAVGTIIWSRNKSLSFMCFAFGVVVGMLRVIIKVHYPIDIIAGAVFGIVVGFIANHKI